MSMKENNNQTGHESFGMTAEAAAELLSKISFAPLKTTDVDPVPTLEETVIDRDKARREACILVDSGQPMGLDDPKIANLYPYNFWQEAFESLQSDMLKYINDDMDSMREAIGIIDKNPRVFSYIPSTGPSPRKGGFCGHCATVTDKERKKLDSCPECGKSYYAYRGGKRR